MHTAAECPDVVMDPAETDDQDEEGAQRTSEEHPNSSEEMNNLPELDNEPKIAESKLSLLCFINHNSHDCLNVY